MATKSFTGSKASFKLNGVKVAFISDVNVTVENTLTDIDVIDQLEIAELAETAHKCSFTISLFKVNENAAAQLSLDPANIRDILTQPELTMEIYDSVEDVVRFEATGCKFEGGSGSVNARGVWSGTWNFKARRGRGL